MALAHAVKLLNDAQSGERKLTAPERRHCIQYLQATQPDLTGAEMAEWFQVTDRTIREDKHWLRKQKARFVQDELKNDLSLVIADISLDFEKQVMDIEKSKAKARLGSHAYLEHCKAVFDMRLKMISAFQDMGYLPKNLGNMTVDKFEYKAVVMADGSTITRQVDAFDQKLPELPPAEIEMEVQEAQFVDVEENKDEPDKPTSAENSEQT